MLQSMTGYGKAEQTAEKKKITVELRSLNSKALDMTFKMPAHYREKEHALRSEIARTVQRGKLEVLIAVEEDDPGALTAFHGELFLAYYTRLDALLKTVGSSARDEQAAQAILRLPAVLEGLPPAVSDGEWQTLSACLQQALADFDHFRQEEGQALGADILAHVAAIEQLLDDIAVYEPQRIESLRQRLNAGLEAFFHTVGYDKNRFEQELLYYLEKIDITEEKIRLRQHCRHFCQTIEHETAAGRKLGFIAQEMGREINTLGAKANCADIQQRVVQMKDELEKIKEQLLNIL
ncbi:MAG: YicC family protein [Prevotellaceae bacterium]|jgi:uncharacterized protein (TIGR00255 family)|nr:YicC family protein [Prevotellaceae bacterium]